MPVAMLRQLRIKVRSEVDRDFPKLGAQSAFQILERNAVPVAVLGKLRIKIKSEAANQLSRASTNAPLVGAMVKALFGAVAVRMARTFKNGVASAVGGRPSGVVCDFNPAAERRRQGEGIAGRAALVVLKGRGGVSEVGGRGARTQTTVGRIATEARVEVIAESCDEGLALTSPSV